ncbi:putative 3-methyladenine DNA glycosylase [Companilactobacillus sp. RD055328]|uniref:DNA-3-methyladenine glycosylase n=1 Tax=Companilactobacillus sp. RD055328 TaxID=2916634 RepID=UPI001FC82FB5|nr:DNA-3-methyladenine glycosylase [Companilactobacillus sp. RD055328]GKQ42468.1 putative 3-methyladenine DNA glycosylase [Companilactobacillus sp. RD055328]
MNIQDFFENLPTQQIAQDLLGRTLSYKTNYGLISGLIVETEAYLGIKDKAAHSYNGRHTPSNDPLYQSGGTIYIYSIHSYLDMDISAQVSGNPNGILIRGLEPLEGIDVMNNNRQVSQPFELTNGPAKWMRAFGILDKDLSGTMLNTDKLFLSDERIREPKIITNSPRIGVNNKEPWTSKKLRYYVQGNPYVSKSKKSEFDLKNYGWK